MPPGIGFNPARSMRKLEAAYGWLLAALAAVAGVIFALTAILITVNVILRAGFSSAILGLFEAVEFGLLAATFLAAPWVLARNGHVTVDIGLMGLPDRPRRLIGRFTNLLGAALCAIFLYYSLSATLASAARGSMIRTSFILPEWWVLGVMPFALALMTVEFLLRSGRGVTAKRHRVEL
jgi:TRAP-type C4-dicarboxylate transport system permease small subunit